jgi:hypothetical protein
LRGALVFGLAFTVHAKTIQLSDAAIRIEKELFFESAEPSFDDQPLEELLELFPEGL